MKKKDAIFAFFKRNLTNYLHPSNNQIYTFLLRYLLSEKVTNFTAFDSTIFCLTIFTSTKWFHLSKKCDAYSLKVTKTL